MNDVVVILPAPTTYVIETSAVGPQGPPSVVPGPAGPKGDPGPQGIAGNQVSRYTAAFDTPALEWLVVHNLQRTVLSVTTYDTDGNEIVGDVDFVDSNSLTIDFAFPVSGTVLVQ